MRGANLTENEPQIFAELDTLEQRLKTLEDHYLFLKQKFNELIDYVNNSKQQHK